VKSKPKRRIIIAVFFITIALSLFALANIYFSAGPSLTCLLPASNTVQPGISSRTLLSGGIQRCYVLFIPTGYEPTSQYPVVFALHGFAGNGNGLRQIAVWEPVAEKEKFIVVYPDGSSFPLRWNIGPIANIPTVDDVQFIRDAITHLSRIASVDKERIYVSGFSNGGQMTHRIACTLADQIAAVGIVDGFDPGMLTKCTPSRPISVMAFWGEADPVAGVRYPKWFQKLINVTIDEDEPPLPANAIDKWLEDWAKRDGCNLNYVKIPSAGNVNGIRYQGCRDGADVLLYLIEGQGHAWPGGPSLPLLGDSSSEINASEALWEFFRNHPLNTST
jgi:polyhydroxybutyrate depolymerase